MTTPPRFEFGEQVRHARRPEWGVGAITRAEDVTVDGTRAQRLSVRFPGVGVKTLVTSQAQLERVSGDDGDGPAADDHTAEVQNWDRMTRTDWIAPIAERKLDEAMVAIPDRVKDPFLEPRERLARAVDLWRYDRTGHGLIDWAIAQTGMDDPLSRFNRHELEQFFDRWALERDAWLARLVREESSVREHVDGVLASAAPAARRAVQRVLRQG